MAECGAKTRSGDSCGQAGLENGRCRFHGGLSLRGAAVGTFKTGRYSKYMPERLLARYHEAESDPDLLSLASEVALVDARLSELLERVDSRETGATWTELGEALQSFTAARAGGDVKRMTERLAEMERLIAKGASDASAWAELQSLLESRRKLVESERKRYVEMGQVATLDQVYTLIGAMAALVREHVHDRVALNAISAGLARLTGGPTERGVGAGAESGTTGADGS